jgi:5,10-methylenetetrahydromethanopterin reductase
MSVTFGLRVPMVGTPQDTGAYAAKVEAAGFDFMYTPDTPLLAGLWRDVYQHLLCSALETKTMRLGPGVTNPITRHPVATAGSIITLYEASGGRADLVVGTGYSSAYIVGKKAATRAAMRSGTELWRSIFSGAPTELGSHKIELKPSCPDLPIYLAASGPLALQLAGEVADGVLIMVGSAPTSVAWALEQVDIGLERAGRIRADIRCMLVATACVDDDRDRAIDRMRPCVAGLCRHAHSVDLFKRAGLDLPIRPVDTVDPYPDLGHAVDWEEAKRVSQWVPDDAVVAMMPVGPVADVAAHAQSLIDLGIDAIWWRDEGTWARPDALMEALSIDVLPRLRG